MIQQVYFLPRTGDVVELNRMLAYGWNIKSRTLLPSESVDYFNQVTNKNERAVFTATLMFILEIDNARYEDWVKENKEEEDV